MIYLVITDRGVQAFPRSPEDLELLFDQLVDTLEILSKLKARGKILAGGMPAGQRKHTFIIEAECVSSAAPNFSAVRIALPIIAATTGVLEAETMKKIPRCTVSRLPVYSSYSVA